jgi:putative peptidoglycan lipid II flippase
MPSLADSEQRPTRHTESTGRHAFLVAAGILLSKLFGLVRVAAFARYFGQESDAADAFNAAFRIPNFLQTLFGEGVLSASFIPVYARLLKQGNEEEADRVAGAVGAILGLAVSLLVLVGVIATPLFIDLIAPGYHDAKRALVIRLVRILFPGAGSLAMGAWCLGILNSHRKFFLSYSASVAWNVAMIATLVGFGGTLERSALAVYLAWGSVAGSVLVVAVQLPFVFQLARHMRFRMETADSNVREVVRNFGPVFVGRGVGQLSAYVDTLLSTLLPKGAITALFNAQTIYMLPVSLFGMSISAAELPAMASALGGEAEVNANLRRRLNAGLRRIAFFIVPSAMAFLALGDVVAAVVFQAGRFRPTDSQFLWGVLAGSAVGLLASTLSRLYSSTYYALRDTRTPLRFAIVRVVITSALGWLFATQLPKWLGVAALWGVAGLTSSAGIAAWVEFTLLRRALNRRIGNTGLPAALVLRLWLCAACAAAAGWGVKIAIGLRHPKPFGLAILAAYGMVYFAATFLLRIEECRTLTRRFVR